MEALDTYTSLPLTIDPTTKTVSSSDPTLASELEELNNTVREFVSLDTPGQIPPPPAPVKPQRSAQITKSRELGNASYKKGAFAKAIETYNLAIQMAIRRPAWEASGLVREELSVLYNNRSQALMALQSWAEAAVDAEVSVEMKKMGNVKGWWRRGQCLREMGRTEEAAEWVKSGLEIERMGPEKGAVGELETLLRECEKALAK